MPFESRQGLKVLTAIILKGFLGINPNNGVEQLQNDVINTTSAINCHIKMIGSLN